MMRPAATASLLLVLCGCGLPGSAGDANQVLSPPQCDSPFFYVGLNLDGRPSLIESRFSISNPGRKPVAIASVDPSALAPEARRLYDIRHDPFVAPGLEADVKIDYTSDPLPGIPDIRDFKVRFQPESVPVLTLTVVAKRLDGLTLFPGRDIVLRRAAKGSAAQGALYLVAEDRKNLRAELAAPPGPGLEATIQRIQESPELRLPAPIWEFGSVLAVRLDAAPSRPDAPPLVTVLRLATNVEESPEVEVRVAVF